MGEAIKDVIDLSRLNAGTPTFHAGHGLAVRAEGVAMRKAAPTWVLPIPCDFTVITNEGPLTAHAGDYLAYDEKSGHVWPVAASYVEQNYEPVGAAAEATTSASSEMPKASGTPATHPLYAAFEALEAAARYLSARDVADAEVQRVSIDYSPLTRLCGEAAYGLRDYIAEHVGLVTDEHVGLGHDAPVTSLRDQPDGNG